MLGARGPARHTERAAAFQSFYSALGIARRPRGSPLARYPFTKCRKHGELSASVRGPKLNLGCGADIRPASEDWVNVDHYQAEGVVNWDLGSFPFPFGDNSFEYVLLAHVIEHLPYIRVVRGGATKDLLVAVLEEVYRISRPNAIIDIYTPKGTDKHFYANPEHCRPILCETLYGLCEGREIRYVADFRLRLVDCHVKERGFYLHWYLNAYHLMKYLRIHRFGEVTELHAILQAAKGNQAERRPTTSS